MADLTKRPFWDLRRGIDELFDDFMSAGSFPSQSIAQSLGDFRPNLELSETESEYKVMVELPGLKPEEVEITVDQGMLTVRGEKRREEKATRGGVEYTERAYGSFVRTMQLPRTVNADKIQANFESGVLTLTIPKGEEGRPRRIPLGSSSKEAPKTGTAGTTPSKDPSKH
ncbi:MAG TPA: Hsp20/alpha crystallin family protein [Polyangiaceae bacterium]|jgi:HSP20 family protein|nr:Hsp20/alpha crystallin family protein [Polyangiaceae bacterium]